ncbi:hypothetical protein M8494_06125 [Serratia ureilytica]
MKFGAARIRGGHLLLGILKTYSLRHLLKAISQFERINADLLMEQFAAITAHSAENAQDAPAESSAENVSARRAAVKACWRSMPRIRPPERATARSTRWPAAMRRSGKSSIS